MYYQTLHVNNKSHHANYRNKIPLIKIVQSQKRKAGKLITYRSDSQTEMPTKPLYGLHIKHTAFNYTLVVVIRPIHLYRYCIILTGLLRRIFLTLL